jgi:hypothetical protein
MTYDELESVLAPPLVGRRIGAWLALRVEKKKFQWRLEM